MQSPASRSAIVSVALVVAAGGCRKHEVDINSRPCREGECIAGYDCHPELQTCVPGIDVGCSSPGESCPWSTQIGDPCPSPGSFLPCAESVSSCVAGCRTCRQDSTWGSCSDPTCLLGQVWSCSSCSDDCRVAVQNARPVCARVSGLMGCNYDGDCLPGFADADGDRANGCECQRSLDHTELCDGLDNDCDGDVDEGFDLGQACGVGACTGGLIECAGQTATRCDTLPGGSRDRSGVEVCDAVDNDCDGTLDNGFACIAGQVRACDVGGGPASGVQGCEPPFCDWAPCSPRWWDTAWSKRIRLDIDKRVANEELTDVPILVTLTPARVDYDEFLPGGADVRFVAQDGVTYLAHEIELWDPAGTSYIWVKVPAIDPAAASIFIVMYYGNPAASALGVDRDVWSNGFEAVWHLGEEEPGRGRADIYHDATGLGHNGADEIGTADAKSGRIGRGQGVNGVNEAVAVPSLAGLVGGAVTLEGWVNSGSASRAFVRPVTFSVPTDRPDSQVALIFPAADFDFASAAPNGCDLRFFSPGLDPVPHFVESWNPAGDSVVWLRVLESGTTEVTMYYGNPGATVCASDPRAVFDFWADFPGTALDTSVWTAQSYDYSVSGGRLHIRQGGVGLTSPLPFNLQDNYVIEVISRPLDNAGNYGGTIPEVSSSRFVAGGNGNSDALVMVMRDPASTLLRAWLASGVGAGYELGSPQLLASTTNNQDMYTALVVLPNAAYVNVGTTTVLAQGGISWKKQMHYLSFGIFNGQANADTQNTDYGLVRVRKVAAWPDMTLGERTVAGVSSAGGFGFGVAGGVARASVADATVATPLNGAGWAYVSMVWASPTLQLYVDGVAAATTASSTIGLTAPRPLLLGDLAGLAGALDEVRVSGVARPPAWVVLQHRSMIDALLTYGPPESVP